jgi:hypothetical protein
LVKIAYKFDSKTTIYNLEDFIKISKINPKETINHLGKSKFQQWLKDIGDQESADFAALISKSKILKKILAKDYYSYDDPKQIEDNLLRKFLVFLIFNHPLIRAEVYITFQRENLDVFDIKSQFSEDHTTIFAISHKLSIKNLAKLIEECEASEEPGFIEVRAGIFKKWTFNKEKIKRLLPKLKHLLNFKKTGELYISKEIEKFKSKNIYERKIFKRGGFGEPYCSDKCYREAGARITGSLIQGITGLCAFCKSPVEKRIYYSNDIAFPYKGKTFFICKNCLDEGQDFVKKIDECCMCGKIL